MRVGRAKRQRRQWNLDADTGLAWLAGDGQPAGVGLDHPGDDRQSQSRAPRTSGVLAVSGGEPFPHPGQQVRGDARPVVDDVEPGLLVVHRHGDRHCGSRWGMYSGIGQQVGQHLLEPS